MQPKSTQKGCGSKVLLGPGPGTLRVGPAKNLEPQNLDIFALS